MEKWPTKVLSYTLVGRFFYVLYFQPIYVTQHLLNSLIFNDINFSFVFYKF